MVLLSETGSWKSSGRVLGRKTLSTNTALGGPDGCVSKRYVLHLAGRFVGFLLPMMAVGFDYFGDGFWWHVTPVLLGPLVPVQHPLAVLGVADRNSLGWHSARCRKCAVR